jgi:tetratricopeptide (TPR) repeat protein
MIAFRVALTAVLLSLTATASATELSPEVTAAEKRLRDGDLDGALVCLEPLLESDPPNETSQALVSALAARILHLRGEEHFRQGRISQSIADFDRQIQLQPQREAEHWQRGIALYYAGDFAAGARQFKLHQTVNPQDVENAAWHFLCESRCSQATVEGARERLIQVTRDPRAPMSQIQQMFAGLMTPEEVLQVGEKAGGEAKFYADLYAGLYYEALGRDAESMKLMRNAADNPAARGSYMGDVARVHVALRTGTTEARRGTRYCCWRASRAMATAPTTIGQAAISSHNH